MLHFLRVSKEEDLSSERKGINERKKGDEKHARIYWYFPPHKEADEQRNIIQQGE